MVVKGLSARLHGRNFVYTFAAEKKERDMSKLSNIEKGKFDIPIVTTAVLGVVLIIFGIVLLVG